MTWRLLNTITDKAAYQMAVDEAMLAARAAGETPNTLRFFTWEPPAITVGYFQSLEQEVDIAAARESGIDLVRRYTGGGAVYHDQELTYSLVLSEAEAPADIVESYGYLCSGVVEGLRLLGLAAEFKPINDCLVNGRKISGSGQTRKNGVILQHGTILLGVDVDRMFSLLKVPDEKIKDKLIASVKERVTSVKNELGREIGTAELEKSFTAGFAKALGAEFKPGELTDAERAAANKLYKEKYSTDAWNFWR